MALAESSVFPLQSAGGAVGGDVPPVLRRPAAPDLLPGPGAGRQGEDETCPQCECWLSPAGVLCGGRAEVEICFLSFIPNTLRSFLILSAILVRASTLSSLERDLDDLIGGLNSWWAGPLTPSLLEISPMKSGSSGVTKCAKCTNYTKSGSQQSLRLGAVAGSTVL